MQADRVGPRVLVVIPSRSEHTRKVALAMARRVGADVETLFDAKNREGVMGSIRSRLDMLFRRPAALRKPAWDPSAYDLVVIGMTSAGDGASSPIRAYAAEQKGRFRSLALFMTHEGNANGSAFQKIEAIVGERPRAFLALRHSEVEARSYARKVDTFLTTAGVSLNGSTPFEHLGLRDRREAARASHEAKRCLPEAY